MGLSVRGERPSNRSDSEEKVRSSATHSLLASSSTKGTAIPLVAGWQRNRYKRGTRVIRSEAT